MCWSFFLSKKSELSPTMIQLVKQLNTIQHVKIKYIRCDSACENKFSRIKALQQVWDLSLNTQDLDHRSIMVEQNVSLLPYTVEFDL
jgi:hypothetical protein